MLTPFVVAVFVCIACFIDIWWSPQPFISFILVLFSTLNLSAGIIDGLVGGLFIGSELRALKEFEHEITNAMGEGKRFEEVVRDFLG